MKTISKTDITIFLKTEHTTENMIEYFTGIKTDMALLVLFKRKKPVLFISSLEEISKRSDLTIKHLDLKEITLILSKESPKIIGLHDLKLTRRGYDLIKKITPKGVKFKDVTDELADIRSIKSKKEIKSLKDGVKITENIIGNLIKNIPKMTYEQEAIDFLNVETTKLGFKTSFDPLIATGPKAESPHYYPDKKSKLKKGFCIIDFGIVYNNLCTDVSRTIYLGKPKKEEIDFYNKVRDGQINIEKNAVPDKKLEYPFKMIHALGHGIGIQVHESPMLPTHPIKIGNCVAIEPALYSKKMSVRIEDDFLMTKNGLKRFNTSSRNLVSVNFK